MTNFFNRSPEAVVVDSAGHQVDGSTQFEGDGRDPVTKQLVDEGLVLYVPPAVAERAATPGKAN